MHLKRQLNIPLDGLVLEIGGGVSPHPQSDILVDYFVDEAGFRHRGGQPLVIGNRVLIQADGALLPFRDHQFNYVVLSHVIEHIAEDKIVEFTNELQRVGLSGYIETPSILYEAIRDVPEHIWYVVCADEVLHLCKKTVSSLWKPFLDPLFDDGDFCSVVEKHADLFFTGLEWTSKFKVEIHEDFSDLYSIYPEGWASGVVSIDIKQEQVIKYQNRNKEFIKSLIPPLVWDKGRSCWHSARNALKMSKRKRVIDWKDLVVCPVCYSELVIDLRSNRINCRNCHRVYLIRDDGIPSFILS